MTDAELSLAVAKVILSDGHWVIGFQPGLLRVFDRNGYYGEFDYRTDGALGKMAVYLGKAACDQYLRMVRLALDLASDNPHRATAEFVLEIGGK